ncbi:hypothetical protein [Tessaracoccus sp. ZS01]|uniref:hypothetical protein n=1 Tax=Tessaracoccus sp. ZS01 TaxID=1906324 RepID=UPI00096FBE6C|nr:hypothetical protein [Tessaracoccus sp. ZS01]MCG6567802.1 hypothetical protein [Tessaracoccus sp. ZS01]OMG55536.1 hypothetical protein BJN44_09265 [Tessaracoccus sp. ZS01]
MRVRPLVIALIALITVFMIGTVIIAVTQESIGWGWWWAVPLGGAFMAVIVGFRLVIQRSQEAADRADAEYDAQHPGDAP